MRRITLIVAAFSAVFISGCGNRALVGSGPEMNTFPGGWSSIHPVRVNLPLNKPVFSGQARPDLAGAVLVNIWASDCTPCLKELPLLQAASTGNDITIVGLSRDLSRTAVQDALTRYEVRYANWTDTEAAFAVALDGRIPMNAVPASVLIRGGKAVAVHIGPFSTVAEILGFPDHN